MMTNKPTFEPFTASFTGSLKTFVAKDGTRYTFPGNGIRIEKDREYMLKMVGNQITFLPLLPAKEDAV